MCLGCQPVKYQFVGETPHLTTNYMVAYFNHTLALKTTARGMSITETSSLLLKFSTSGVYRILIRMITREYRDIYSISQY